MKNIERKRMPLSEVEIRSLKPAEKSYKMGDGGGLYLEVFPNGSKLWRMKYRFAGKEKRLVFGAWPTVSLKLAREGREQAKSLLAQGIDPGEHKKQQQQKLIQQATETERTFSVVAMDWFNTQTTSNSDKIRQCTLSRMNLHILPVIGSKPFKDVSFDDLVAICRKLERENKHEMARRIAGIISLICRYAKIMRWSANNISEDLTTILEKRPVSSKKGHPAIVDLDGVANMLRKIQSYVQSCRSGPIINAALQLGPIVMLRSEELYLADWSEIDFENKIWHIPAEHMKCKKDHEVPLSEQALTIFKTLWQYRRDNGKIFHSGGKDGHITGNGLNTAMHLAGIEKGKMCWHGWRKVWGTLAREAGVPSVLVEKQLAHTIGTEVSRAYDKSKFINVRSKMMQWWSDYLDALRDGCELPKYILQNSGLFE